MTAKEKEWIIRLQMIQLQSENPYHEDYYYQVRGLCFGVFVVHCLFLSQANYVSRWIPLFLLQTESTYGHK